MLEIERQVLDAGMALPPLVEGLAIDRADAFVASRDQLADEVAADES
jgi:hypothetical protein